MILIFSGKPDYFPGLPVVFFIFPVQSTCIRIPVVFEFLTDILIIFAVALLVGVNFSRIIVPTLVAYLATFRIPFVYPMSTITG